MFFLCCAMRVQQQPVHSKIWVHAVQMHSYAFLAIWNSSFVSFLRNALKLGNFEACYFKVFKKIDPVF